MPSDIIKYIHYNAGTATLNPEPFTPIQSPNHTMLY